jgi:hypothetical protein
MFQLKEQILEKCRSGNLSQKEKLHDLSLISALSHCVEGCDYETTNKLVQRLLKQKELISNEDFCNAMNFELEDMYVPRNTRNLEKRLNYYGLKLEDLNFDLEQTEADMIAKLTRLAHRTRHPKNDNFYSMIVSLALVADRIEYSTKIVHLKDAFELPTTSQTLIDHPQWSLAAIAIFLVRLSQAHNDLWDDKSMDSYIRTIISDAKRRSTQSNNYEMLEAELSQMMRQFVEMEADTHFADWDKLDTLISALIQQITDWTEVPMTTMVAFLRYGGVKWTQMLFDLWKYREGQATAIILEPSFPNLSQDLLMLAIQDFPDITFDMVQKKLDKLRNGIIARVMSTTADSSLTKLRTMLRFFPAPYVKFAFSIVGLLFPGTEGVDFACNCNCSTQLGVILANEIGLLGSTVHLVTGPHHLYLATGNRQTDWQDRKVQVIETTSRHEEDCPKPLRTLIQIEEDNKFEPEETQYTKNDYLEPNDPAFLLLAFVGGSLSLSHANYMIERFTHVVVSFFGAVSWMKVIHFFRKDLQDSNINSHIFQLAKKEALRGTQDLYSINIQLLSGLQNILGLSTKQPIVFKSHIKTIVQRLAHDSLRSKDPSVIDAVKLLKI